MPNFRHFAYSDTQIDTETYPGIEQVGNIVYEILPSEVPSRSVFGGKYAGLDWYGGPIEDGRYIIARPNTDVVSNLRFAASPEKTEVSLLFLLRRNFGQTLSTYEDALDWIAAQEFWINV